MFVALLSCGVAAVHWCTQQAGAADKAVARGQSPDGPTIAPQTWNQPSQNGQFGNQAQPVDGGSSGGPSLFGPPGRAIEPHLSGENLSDPAQSAMGVAPHPASQEHTFANAQIIARVGSETILASDVVPLAEEALKRRLAELPKDQREAMTAEMYEKLKWQFTEALLTQMIEIKIRYADAIATIPKDNLPQVRKNINDKFDQSVQKALMTRFGATTRSELEEKMAAAGQSLDRQRQLFLERSLASGWEEQHVKDNREIPLSEILGYYQQHIAEFEHPAKTRWEQLMVSFDRFTSKDEAYAALANMGNEVLRGADLAEVARRQSHGPTASKGGAYDWTSKGSLVSKVLDEAIFTLPVGRMSQILEDEKGFHIVRVLERTEAGRTPFLEAQLPIRKKLREEDVKQQRDEFMAKMKARTPVWTIFDSQRSTPGSTTGAEDALGSRPTQPVR